MLWDSDLHLPLQSSSSLSSSFSAPGYGRAATNQWKLRLFDPLDVERVFSQIVFARDMLTCRSLASLSPLFYLIFTWFSRVHMLHQYDKVLHDLL